VPATERHPFLEPAILDYIAARAAPPDDVLLALHDETVAALGDRSRMQVSPDEGALLSLLTRLVGARNAVEVGTFTGYSSICIARGLVDEGKLLCCDVSEEFTTIARRAWVSAGVSDRIELRLAPAVETLRALPRDEPIDLAFIDADKGGYVDYFEELVPRVRPGGLLLADNTLWSGRVVEPAEEGSDTAALQAFNDHVAADARVESFILPVRDGLTLIRKR
jgi:caffeoyl-CoA O-methyltransferase